MEKRSIVELTSIQRADCNYSLEWKRQGKLLLENSFDFQSFSKAIHWIGKNGAVLRTVKKCDYDSFVHYLYENIESIKNGEFDFNNIQINIEAKPISWVSKVCHIMNPVKYPIIYDSKIRSIIKTQGFNTFDEAFNYYRSTCRQMSNEEIYLTDSELWAKATEE